MLFGEWHLIFVFMATIAAVNLGLDVDPLAGNTEA